MRPLFLPAVVLVCLCSCRRPIADQEPARPVDAPPAAVTPDRPAASTGEADEGTAEVPYHNPLTEDERAEGWISLFDGHTLFGWTANDEDVNWHVEQGVIAADSGPIGLLLTNVPFADYELVCEYRMEEGGNSGVFLRTLPVPQDVVQDCYEINIADDHPEGYLTGSIVGHKRTDEPIPGSGDWQTLRMTIVGNRIEVEHEGDTVLQYVDESEWRRSGLIGLQKNAGRIEFRKIVLKPREMTALFNGEDLSGWRVVPGSKSEFFVDEGVIRALDGVGFLETEETFRDFIFQAEAITHAPELNSGYFFRAMPGTEEAPSNGYEVQIHNGFLHGDRTRPADAGTGGIFRRVDARRVVPDDMEWFTTTLLAHGPRMSVWVDGYQVVDWEDTREPHENPRRGLRLEGGHVSLQGHDPTTDLSFRNLKISEFPAD